MAGWKWHNLYWNRTVFAGRRYYEIELCNISWGLWHFLWHFLRRFGNALFYAVYLFQNCSNPLTHGVKRKRDADASLFCFSALETTEPPEQRCCRGFQNGPPDRFASNTHFRLEGGSNTPNCFAIGGPEIVPRTIFSRWHEADGAKQVPPAPCSL